MEFTTLRQIPAAKAALRKAGYEVISINTLVVGRKGFVVRDEKIDRTMNDYGLLEFANQNA